MSSVTSPLGPRAGAGARPLSDSAAAILEMLRGQPEPLTLAALARADGLHGNTVREHLDVLVRRGLVARHRAEPERARPPGLALRARPTRRSETSEYAGLAAALAAAISRSSPAPAADAAAAGEEWGHDLARTRGAAPTTPDAARDHVVELLDDLGFRPEQEAEDPATVRLDPLPAAGGRAPPPRGRLRGAPRDRARRPRGVRRGPGRQRARAVLRAGRVPARRTAATGVTPS